MIPELALLRYNCHCSFVFGHLQYVVIFLLFVFVKQQIPIIDFYEHVQTEI